MDGPRGPRRIVSLVPSHTETLWDLGLGARVVGRTRFCIHPAVAAAVPVVGGTKDANPGKILALKPDLVVADKDENPKAVVEAIGAAGVEVLWSEIDSVPDAADFVQRLGERCAAAEAGERWAERIRVAFADTRRAAAPTDPVFCPIWHAPWMTFDSSAYPHAMLAAAGMPNAFAGHGGPKYFEVTAREVRTALAAWTLLPSEPFPFHKRAVDTSELGAAGGPERVRRVDGEALTWFGTRTVRGLAEMAKVAASLRTEPGSQR